MPSVDVEKAMTYLRGIAERNPALATQHVSQVNYIEHNPLAADGIEGLREYVRHLPSDDHHVNVVRVFQDGAYVFAQEERNVRDQSVVFDVLRFADGSIVEHWAFSAKAGPPNESGHTQSDGPTVANDAEDTERNKTIVRDYYETVHIGGDHAAIPRYFAADRCIRHEPGVRDGVEAFKRDLDVLTQHRSIDEIALLLGQGDFVFLAAKGTHQKEPCAYIDLYRVESGKLVEHWGFSQAIPSEAESKNRYRML